MAENLTQPFTYRGCEFTCSAIQTEGGTFQPRVIYRGGMAVVQQAELPHDSDPYGSAAEALRHAQQQAVRWVHERTGDGQGRF